MPTRYLFVVGTFLLSLLLYVDRACIATAKSEVTSALSLSDKAWGWVLAAFSLGYALAQTPSGLLADRFGPRVILTAVVSFWSFFTALTGAAWNLVSLVVARFLFGVGEAGAFPGMARASLSWIPLPERGLVTGINFSASRLGGAAAMFLMPMLIAALGWRVTFFVLGGVGFVWAVGWYLWFRNDPTEHPSIPEDEKEHILATRQQTAAGGPTLRFGHMIGSGNMWLTMVQYFCSNFTFFFALTWLYPYVKKTYELTPEKAGLLAAIPLLGGALGNYVSGSLVDALYRRDQFILSRRLPAIIGFTLATVGLLASMHMSTASGAIAFLTLAVFGADMTLSPSWNFCVDVGGKSAGAVSGTMNMAGNIGSFVTSLAFPYLTGWFAASALVGPDKVLTKDTDAFFYIAAALNALAVVLWLLMNPKKPLEER